MRQLISGAAALIFLFLAPAQAHRSGCHRWHSCPSDSGSYACGDLGYTSGCPSGNTSRPVAVPAAAPPVDDVIRYTTSTLNLRSGPGVETVRVATLDKDTRVRLQFCLSGWCKVNAVQGVGYVSQKYLRR
ncbi:SH3b domain-containing protein [Deinococcus saxicola]|uniref:SH3 domain-containing protein n=1 Tax=Deinococcus saxicola TaxID=249406 RepID=UPI0039EE33B5